MDDKLIEIGICGKPHGIKGGFSFHLYSGNESVLNKKIKVTLFPKDSSSSVHIDGEIYSIKSIAFGNKVIVYLEGIADRNITEAMIPFTINIFRSEFPDIKDDDEFYVTDLVGQKVIDHKTKKEIGVIKKFYDNGAQIVFTIDLNGRQIDVPFIDDFFPVVDLENGVIEVVVPVFTD